MIGAFNSLKGLLALMIFVHHLNLYDGGGSLAVAVFFILGGFLSTLGYKDRILSADFCYKNYLIGKAIKFYPLHWLLLLVAVPLVFNGANHLLKNFCILGINASLLQSWIPLPSVYFSGNAVSWYLSDTLFFVAIFPFLLKWMLKGTKISKISVTIGIAITYTLVWIFLPKEYMHRFFYINPLFRIVDYMVGMAAGLFYIRVRESDSVKFREMSKTKFFHLLAWVCFIALVAISFCNKQLVLHSVVYMPLSVLFILLIAINGGGILQNSILQKFGSISFAFFLVHQMCLRYLHIILGKLGYDEIYIVAPLAFILTTIVSYFLTYKFDKKISVWLKIKLVNRQSMTAQS